ncbi:MAG: cytochrome C [Anaeromyxobacter sp.]|nr:cytochrome C [Anaeromyxobacter sp.]
MAYPPRLLPADSWRRVMAGLGTHFGQDAGLDEPLRARLEGWLVERAGPGRAGSGAAPQRITELAWFRDEHREVPRAVVARPSVASLANCAACHQGAARWDFDGDRVRIPPG